MSDAPLAGAERSSRDGSSRDALGCSGDSIRNSLELSLILYAVPGTTPVRYCLARRTIGGAATAGLRQRRGR